MNNYLATHFYCVVISYAKQWKKPNGEELNCHPKSFIYSPNSSTFGAYYQDLLKSISGMDELLQG
jgi:hypothetical protein